MGVPGIRVAVNPVSETEIRCAYALAGHPAFAEVGLVGKSPPNSWRDRIDKVGGAGGFDVYVGGRASGAVSVFVGEGDSAGPQLSHASIAGLARALRSRVDDAVAVVALPGQPSQEGQLVRLPEPVGDIRLGDEFDGIPMGRCQPPWAAAAAVSLDQTLAVIDDHRFLAAACLAAGALIASGEAESAWDRPGEFLAACEEFGLVVAGADQPR